jgi:poly(3-hydroxybutyrate) depolymerase
MKTPFLTFTLFMAFFMILGCEEEKTFSQSRNLEEWLAKPVNQREVLGKLRFASESLSKTDVAEVKEALLNDRNDRLKSDYSEAWERQELEMGTLKMPFFYEIYGDKPVGGRSLFISLHGGGGVAASTNDRQYENQKRLYNQTMSKLEGVYLAPRAATNTWNLWHQDHVDSFLELVIQLAVVNLDVNPNKVYLLGYSAGGDGVYQLAPRMAHRWAAASMMAGHPNDASPLNLRNTPFALHMGAEDSAFDRNLKAQEWKKLLDNLENTDPQAYQHQVVIHEGRSHWMELQDAIALPWMANFERNPVPAKVVWKQDDVHHEQLYWLGVPEEYIETGGEVVAEYNSANNEINILKNYSKTLQLFINDKMLDLDKPVTVKYRGEALGSKECKRTLLDLYESLEKNGDSNFVFSASITVAENKELK